MIIFIISSESLSSQSAFYYLEVSTGCSKKAMLTRIFNVIERYKVSRYKDTYLLMYSICQQLQLPVYEDIVYVVTAVFYSFIIH